VVFPEAFATYGAQLEPETPVLVCGEVSRRDEPPRIIASEVYRLEDAPKFFARQVRIHIPTHQAGNGVLERVREIVRLHPGTTPLQFCLLFPTGEKVFTETARAYRVCPDKSFLAAIEAEVGENSTFVVVNGEPCLHKKRNGRRFQGAR